LKICQKEIFNNQRIKLQFSESNQAEATAAIVKH